MIPGTRRQGRRVRPVRVAAIACAAALAIIAPILLSGFHTGLRSVTPDEPGAAESELETTQIVGIRTFTPPADIRVETDAVYGTKEDGAMLTLDICSPPEAPALAVDSGADATVSVTAAEAAVAVEDVLRPAVVSIHGGSWARGDKGNSDWRGVCEWFASEGFVAFSLNYRLVPDAIFPAAIDDVSLAVEWIRDPENAARFGIDPDRIGAFGGSAGGNLAALLGARGSGSLTEGARVAAVAELSGPVDLEFDSLIAGQASPGLRKIVLDYLGCASFDDCAQAHDASPITALDPTDPPVFIGASTEEFIPLEQSSGYAAALAELGIPHELQAVPGVLHSIGILDEGMRAQVAAFLHAHLG